MARFHLSLLSLAVLTATACSGDLGEDSDESANPEEPGTMSPDTPTNSSGGATGENPAGGTTSGTGGIPSTGGTPPATGGVGTSTGGTTPTDDCTIETILSESEFNALFPNRNSAYTYQGMLEANHGTGDLVGFPLFAAEGDCDTRKRELAAFLANVARETGQLVYIEQINKSFPYCDAGQPYGCPAGTGEYFGRGPIQLSWNYNYNAASDFLFGDDRLLQNPDLVANDPAVAWSTGFWFWMLGGAGGDGSFSPHSVMVDGTGFGATIDIINGFEECNGGTQPYAEEAVSQRVCYYEKYTTAFGVSVGGGDLTCGTSTNDSHCQWI